MSWVSSFAGSALGVALGDYRDRKNYKTQKKLMDYQNQLDIQNWNMVNEYNSPSAQMARYSEAGLNPNLIYGQSNTASGISAPSGRFDSSIPDVNPVADYFAYKNIAAETKNKEKQNSLLQSQADYVDEQTKGVALENMLREIGIASLRGDNPFEANPNDPYWYRDIKKGLEFAGRQLVNARSTFSEVEQRYGRDGLPVWLNPRSYRQVMEDYKSQTQNKVQWQRRDKGGR